MLDENINALSGPDFLEAIADNEAGEDRFVNADVYRERAREWRHDQQEKQRLQTALEEATLALTKAHRRTFGAAPPHRHAITPSGNR